jgi:hypothetical protein
MWSSCRRREAPAACHPHLRLPWCPKRQLGDTTNDFAPDFFFKSTEKNPGIFYGYKKFGKLLNTSFKKNL